MKRAQLIGISIAGTAGMLAFVLMKGIVSKPAPAPKTVALQVNSTDVLVARADISLGQVVNESHFKWQAWPKDALSPSFIAKSGSADAMREMAGRIARAPIMAGEPVTKHKLVKPGDGGVLAAILPAGMRAISTKIKEETAAGRLILPNDHVDVILIRRLRNRSQEEQVSDTLFRNVRVLAIGQQIESKEGKKAAEGAANTATLELTPKQAELLALANSMGEISLALRSVADMNSERDGPSAANDLKRDRGNAVKILRYGIASRAYGVN
jgi:pilus assembly protein CpaB